MKPTVAAPTSGYDDEDNIAYNYHRHHKSIHKTSPTNSAPSFGYDDDDDDDDDITNNHNLHHKSRKPTIVTPSFDDDVSERTDSESKKLQKPIHPKKPIVPTSLPGFDHHHHHHSSHQKKPDVQTSSFDNDSDDYRHRHHKSQNKKRPTVVTESDELITPTLATTHSVVHRKIYTPKGHRHNSRQHAKNLKMVNELYDKVNMLYKKMDSLLQLETLKKNTTPQQASAKHTLGHEEVKATTTPTVHTKRPAATTHKVMHHEILKPFSSPKPTTKRVSTTPKSFLKNIAEHFIERPMKPPEKIHTKTLYMRPPLKSDLIDPSGKLMLDYIKSIYDRAKEVHQSKIKAHLKKQKKKEKVISSGDYGSGSKSKKKRKQHKRKKEKYYKHYHEEKAILEEIKDIYRQMKEMKHKDSSRPKPDELFESDTMRSTIPHPRKVAIVKPKTLVTTPTRNTVQPHKPTVQVTLRTTRLPVSFISKGKSKTSEKPTVGPTKAKTTVSMDNMINQIAENVANDVIKKMQHNTTMKPTKATTVRKKKRKVTHPKTESKPTKNRIEHKGSIKKEFSTLLSKLESVKKVNSNSKNAPKTNKPEFQVQKDQKSYSKTDAHSKNALLAEAVSLLKGISNKGTASPTLPTTTTNPALHQAVELLKSISSLKESTSRSSLKKAVDLLKDLNNSRISATSKPTKTIVATKPYIKPTKPGTDLEKAIEILRNLQAKKLLKKHSSTQPEGQRPRENEAFLRNAKEQKQQSERKNTKSEESTSTSPHVPDIPPLDSMDSNSVIKSQESSQSSRKLLQAPSSKDESFQHIIDTAAQQAAEEVEKSILKHEKQQNLKKVLTEPTSASPQQGSSNVAQKMTSHGSDRDFEHIKTQKASPSVRVHATKQGTTGRRFTVPLPSIHPADKDYHGLDKLTREELKAMLKSRQRWLSMRNNVEALKKFDIPQETFGNEAYLVVHLSFESAINGRVYDSSGLHNNGKASPQTKITTDDTKCGKALVMNGGHVEFNSRSFNARPHEAITIALWVKFPQIDNQYNLFTTEGTGAKYTFQVTEGKVHWSHLNDNGHVVFSMETESVINLGSWVHIGVTYDSRTNLSKVIVNGDVVGQKHGFGRLSQNWDGKSGIGLSGGLHGTVDEFYMYNRALAASDIQDISEECNLSPDEAIPMREGSFTGIIPQHEIEEALARISGFNLTTANTQTTAPPTKSTTPTTKTTPTTTPTTPKTTPTTTPKTTPTTTPTTPKTTTPTTPKTSPTTPKPTLHTTPRSTPPSTHPAAKGIPTIPPLNVQFEEPKCQKSFFYHNSKLQGGMDAGLFIDLGRTHVTTQCLKKCCEIETCDLVYMANDHCYAVDCFTSDLCQPVEAFAIGKAIPSIYYVMRHGKTILDKALAQATVTATLFTPTQQYILPTTTPPPYTTYEEVDDDMLDTIYEPQPTEHRTPDHRLCTQSMFFYNVKLRSGFKAGTVLVHTFAKGMHNCLQLCCQDRTCDIALLRKGECYTMHCGTGHCTVEDGGDFQISFVSRQGADFDDLSIFPTLPSTTVASPTLGSEVTDQDNQRLSLYFGFDHVVESMVVDGSGMNNDGKLTKGASLSAGRVGPGIKTNGGHILLHGKHFRGKPRDAVTIAAWVKLSTIEGLHSIFSTIGSHSVHRKGQYNFEVYDGRIRWYHRDQLSRIVFKLQTPPVFTTGRWHHVAGTYNSKEGMARIYMNGNLQGLSNGQGRLSQDWDQYAGFGSLGGHRKLHGFLDELYIFRRALSGREIHKYVKNIKCATGTTAFNCENGLETTVGPFGSSNQIVGEATTIAPLKEALELIGSNHKTASTTAPTTQPTTPTTPATTPSTTEAPTTTPSTTKAPTTTQPTTQSTTKQPTTTTTPTPPTVTSKPATIKHKSTNTCKLGNVYRNRDLIGGLGAGNFTDQGRVTSIEQCMRLCCEMENCTVAYKIGTSCFAVECRNERLCKTFTRDLLDVSPEIGFVNRFNHDGVSIAPFTFTEATRHHPSTGPTTRPPTQPLIDIGPLTNTGTVKIPTTPTCSHSDVYRHVTLKEGLEAGNFTKLAEFSNIAECTRKCCAKNKCDVAIVMSSTCFGLECKSSKLCETRPARLKNFKLIIVYIQRNTPDEKSPLTTTLRPLTTTTKPPSLEDLLGKVNPTNQPTTVSFLAKALGKIQTIPSPKPTTKPTNKILCSQGLRINNVILNGGMGSGEVTQYLNVSDINECESKCCQSNHCDVAFVISDVCYTINCYSRDLCRTRPIESSKFTSRVVYVSRNGVTMFSSANNARVGGSDVTTTAHPTTTNTMPTETPVSLEDGGSGHIESTERPIPYRSSKTNTIPKAQDYNQTTTMKPLRCVSGENLVNVRLKGDLDAGTFVKKGLASSMIECSYFCCEDRSCDLAYLLENICYTVSCRSADLCQPVSSSPTSINPIISYVTRYDNDGNIKKNPNGPDMFVITQAPPSELPTSSPTTHMHTQHTDPPTTTQPTHATHHHTTHHEIKDNESEKHEHVHHHDDEENEEETKEHHHKDHSKKNHQHHKQHHDEDDKPRKHDNHHHKHHHGDGHNDDIEDYRHHGDSHHGNGHHDDDHNGEEHHTKSHHGDHDSHKTTHEGSEKEDKSKETKKIDSIISRLSPDDLETIASLNIAGNGASLEEITRCTASDYGCQHYCINLPNGGHRCMCHHGYTLTVNGRHCQALDECYEDNHGCEHRCINTYNNYTCQCNSGFMLNADGKHCDDLDECKLEIHSCSQQCQNTPGSYRCYCKQGYTLDTDRVTCRRSEEMGTRKDDLIHLDQGLQIPSMIVQSPQDKQAMQHETAIFQCKARGHPAPHIAWAVGPNGDQPLPSDDRFGLLPNGALVIRSLNISDTGLYRCVASNPAGSAAEGAFLHVQDQDECSTGSHVCDQQCINTVGSYHCRCKTGYLINNDGKTCDDIDECTNGSQRCSQECHNTLGSYLCSCHSGYKLHPDKSSCIDIDECSTRDHGCSQLCNNTQGSYDCYCLHGFTLAADNVTCVGQASVVRNVQKSTTLSAGMAAFAGLLIVSCVLVMVSIVCGIHSIKKRLRGGLDDEEKAYKKSIFSWLE